METAGGVSVLRGKGARGEARRCSFYSHGGKRRGAGVSAIYGGAVGRETDTGRKKRERVSSMELVENEEETTG